MSDKVYISYPNQKVFDSFERNVPNRENPQGSFFYIYKKDVMNAFKELSHSAFGVYLYLVSFSGSQRLFFSPKAVTEETGICEKSVQNAIKELIEKDYITNPSGNHYTFRWVVEKAMPISRKPVKRHILWDDGTTSDLTHTEFMKELEDTDLTMEEKESYWGTFKEVKE